MVHWESFIDIILDLIADDEELNEREPYFQSLLTHCFSTGLSDLRMYRDWKDDVHDRKGPFTTWSNIPKLVCVTLSVPSECVKKITDFGGWDPVQIWWVFGYVDIFVSHRRQPHNQMLS